MLIRGPEPADETAINRLFTELVQSGDTQRFHPHPFTSEEALHLTRGHSPAGVDTNDIYRFGFERGEAVAYGMLRGWDEGYAEPSLGIAVHPGFRGQGLARIMLAQLHDLARMRGATSVRLKVYKDNAPAVSLYHSLGYTLTDFDDHQWLGQILLPTTVSNLQTNSHQSHRAA